MAEKLCLRTYGELIRPYMKKKSIFKPNVGRVYTKKEPINGSGIHAFYSMLLDSLIHSIDDNDYVDIPDLNNSLTTRIRSGAIDIPSKIVEIAQRSTIIGEVEEYFSEYLIPNLPQKSLDTVNDAILSLIDGDTSIGETKQKMLKDSFTPVNPAHFYAEVFVYAVQRNQNKMNVMNALKVSEETVSDEKSSMPCMLGQKKVKSDIYEESIFICLEKENLYFSNYYSHAERLYYPEHTIDEYLNKLSSNSAIVIKGRQGAGKTTIALKLAELFQTKNQYYRIMYTNLSIGWHYILAQTQYLRNVLPDSMFIWVIDDIHKSVEFEQDIVNWHFSGNDKYIFITRNIDKTKGNPHRAESSRWDDENVIKLDINNITFAKYLYADPHYASLTYRDVEKIFSMCGGDLTLLENYKVLYGKSISDHSGDEQNVLRDVFSFYFPNSRFTVQMDEFMDALKMLAMGMLDFPIPPSLQNRACNTILAQFCYSNIKGELEFEHASIAELLFSCITNYLQMDFILIYEQMVRDIGRELVSPSLRKEAIAFRVNTFLQSMLNYKFTLPINKGKKISINRDTENEDTVFILRNHAEYISPSTWKLLLNDQAYRQQNIDLFKESIRGSKFIKGILNSGDYNFRFIYKVLPENEISVINEGIIHNIRLIAAQIDNSSIFVLLLRSLKDDAAITFLEKLDQETIIRAVFKNDDGFFGFSCGLKYLHAPVIEKLEEKIGANYLEKIIYASSVSAILQFLEYFLINRQFLLDLVNKHRNIILENQMTNSYSVRRICEIQSIIKRIDSNLLRHIEQAFTEEFYLALLEGMGNIQDLYDLLASCSTGLRTRIIGYLQRDAIHASALVNKMSSSTYSIGTLNLSLKTLKKESSDDFEWLDQILGDRIIIDLISDKGTAMDLLRIVSITTPYTAEKILNTFTLDRILFSAIIKRTIEKRVSIGTMGLILHDFDNTMLLKIEELFTAKTYMELCRGNGNLAVLLGIIQYSSANMQIELAKLLKENKRLKNELLNNTLEDEKKIGTFALCLKSLKEENEDSLTLFEKAMEPNGYLKIIHSRGNIVILSRFLQYMSDNMRKKMIETLKRSPMTFDTIFENTFIDETSAGTFHFSLREMQKQDNELLQDFETILGASRYLRIICDLGNLNVLFQILQYSSPKMTEEIIKEFEKDENACRKMIVRTLTGQSSIRAISLPLKEINKKNPNLMDIIDKIIGAEDWISLFVKKGDIMTLFGCLSEMSHNMKVSILHQLAEHHENFDLIISNTVENKISLGTLPLRIKSLNSIESDVNQLVEELFTPDVFLLLMEKQGKMSTFILTLGEVSPYYLNSIQQKDLFPIIDKVFDRSVLEKDVLFNVHYGLRELRIKDLKLLYLIEGYVGGERYRQLFMQGSSLFNVLRLTAYSTLGEQICNDILEDEEYFETLLKNIGDANELSNGFEIEMYSAIMRRNSCFERLINEKISDDQWLEYFKDKCNLCNFLYILRWLQGEKIKRIADAIVFDINLLNYFCSKWSEEISDELLNSKYTTEALEIIRGYSPMLVDRIENIVTQKSQHAVVF